jgi:hypothetical protein
MKGKSDPTRLSRLGALFLLVKATPSTQYEYQGRRQAESQDRRETIQNNGDIVPGWFLAVIRWKQGFWDFTALALALAGDSCMKLDIGNLTLTSLALATDCECQLWLSAVHCS